MNSDTLVSIVIPVYNVAEYIGQLADCLIRQTYNRFEVLWVDDWSTDGSLEIVERYNDDRFNCLKRPATMPKGGPSCRNYGMSLVHGEYMIIIDADDLVPDFFVEQRLKAMLNNPDIDMCVFPAYSFHSEDADRTPITWWGIQNNMEIIESFLRDKYQFTVWTNIYKSSFIKQVHWDEKVKLHQDLDFNISTLLLKPSLMFATEATADYFYRIHEGSVCGKFITDEKLNSSLYLFNKIYKSLNIAYNNKMKMFFWDYMKTYLYRIIGEGTLKHRILFLDFVRTHFGIVRAFRLRMSFIIADYYHLRGRQRLLNIFNRY